MPSAALAGPVLAQAPTLETVATPALWAGTIGAVLLLLVVDFIVTRKPHEVSMKEAIGWSALMRAASSTPRSSGRRTSMTSRRSRIVSIASSSPCDRRTT